MSNITKGFMKKLLAINCNFNFEEGNDGKCRSTICMLNKDTDVAKAIQEKGCTIFKNIKKVNGAYELIPR